jgi:hypothetical protein
MIVDSKNLSDLWRDWTPPPELNRSIPRPVALKAGGVVLYVMSGVFALAGIALFITFQIQTKRAKAEIAQMQVEGQDTEADVVRLWRTGSKTTEYRVRYRFSANGQPYAKDAKISFKHWSQLTQDSLIAVRYRPSDPSHSYPTADPPQILPPWFPFLFGGMFPCIGGMMLWMVRREYRLLEEGKPAPATVVAARWGGYSNGRRNNYVSYEFPLAGGGVRRGRSQTQGRPPAVGSLITIIYNPDNPRRNAKYPLCTVKPATF